MIDKEMDERDLQVYNNDKAVTFYMHQDVYDFLTMMSEDWGISRSGLIRIWVQKIYELETRHQQVRRARIQAESDNGSERRELFEERYKTISEKDRAKYQRLRCEHIRRAREKGVKDGRYRRQLKREQAEAESNPT